MKLSMILLALLTSACAADDGMTFKGSIPIDGMLEVSR